MPAQAKMTNPLTQKCATNLCKPKKPKECNDSIGTYSKWLHSSLPKSVLQVLSDLAKKPNQTELTLFYSRNSDLMKPVDFKLR